MHVPATILAIASPPGRSLRGIVRISGAETFGLLAPHLVAAEAPQGGERWRRGAARATLTLPAMATFSVLALALPAPHSYTGEDSLEVQMPGNPAMLQRVLEALIASGAKRGMDVRRAEPGEFTTRAFLNGQLTLTQAEGVAATIAAQSDAELAAARLLASGRLGAFGNRLADDLASALALVEAGIDFTDQDDVVAIAPVDLHARLQALIADLRRQLVNAVGMEQLRAIPWVALVGEPNAGKSALFNALLGRERTVVSDIAGTTRDAIAEPLGIDTDHGPAEVMLVDIAGLDDADASPMNAMMQRAARAAMERAELKLRCVPVDESAIEMPKRPNVQTPPQLGGGDEIVVRTKCDLNPDESAVCSLAHDRIPVSARTGEGLSDLRRAIAERLSSRAVSLAADALALQPRHEAALRAALANLESAHALVSPQQRERSLSHPELLAASMRSALDDLASLAGDLTPDDILGRIFATFCVGK